MQVDNVDAHGDNNEDPGPPLPGEREEKQRDVPHVFTINERDRLELSRPVSPRSSVTVMGLIHRVMELQTKNKATEATANMMCDLISDVFTDPGQEINYRHHKYMVEKNFLIKVQVLHVCKQDCVLFYDSPHDPAYQYGELNQCPKCGEDRYDENQQPVKRFWYVPLKELIDATFC
jgi:hypothetical protein